MAKGRLWTEEDIEFVRQHLGMEAGAIGWILGRTKASVRVMRGRIRQEIDPELKPAVKAPGEYVERLACYLVDEWDCLSIWLKWNGYHMYRELCRDEIGWVTLICTAKG